MEFHLRPIGTIHSPFTDQSQAPIQASRSHARGTVEVYQEYADGLQDLEGFSHIFLIYTFHELQGYSLLVKPFLDDQLRGLFATRFPARPNPIGLSVVKLIARQGNSLDVEGLDMLDGTPLLDIKPFVADFDLRTDTRSGWYPSDPQKGASQKD